MTCAYRFPSPTLLSAHRHHLSTIALGSSFFVDADSDPCAGSWGFSEVCPDLDLESLSFDYFLSSHLVKKDV